MDIWLDADNQQVPTSIITSRQGPEHCNWEWVSFLTFDDRQYIPRSTQESWHESDSLPTTKTLNSPETATNTGYHREDRQLWMSADRTTTYVVDNDRVEAWGTTDEPIGCA